MSAPRRGLCSILVALDGSPHGTAAATLALDWGRRHGAALVGLGIVDAPTIHGSEAVPLGAGAWKHERDEALLADAGRRVDAFMADFALRCRAAGVTAHLLEEVGLPSARIVEEAYRCDVVILGRETRFHFETQDAPDETLDVVLRQSPRPVVSVPRTLGAGRGVLVACGTGAESARALEAVQALDLAAGEEIHIVAVGPERGAAERRAALAADYAAFHGLEVHVHPVATDARPAGVLLEHVERLGPRLVAMGAHGHPTLRDAFFTSVTRAVLRASAVPVLTSS